MEEDTNIDTVTTTDNVNAEDIRKATAKAALKLIPKVVYIGSRPYAKIVVGVKTEYKFGPDNEFTVRPSEFSHFYQILSDGEGLFALEKDPAAVKKQMDRERVAEARLLKERLVTEIAVENKEKENSSEAVALRKTKRLAELEKEFIDAARHKIATGQADELPEGLENDAKKYAEEKVEEEFSKQEEEAEEKVEDETTEDVELDQEPVNEIEDESVDDQEPNPIANPEAAEPAVAEAETEVKINE